MGTSEELSNAVRRFQEGEREAFNDIYKMSYGYLHTCVSHTLDNENMVQDMLQETYLEIFRSIGQLRQPESFLHWAAAIAGRKCVAWAKKEKQLPVEDMGHAEEYLEEVAESEKFLPESILQNKEKQYLLREIIDRLPPMQWICVVAYYYYGLSQQEIAEELKVPLNTVKSYLSRARKKIRTEVLALEEQKDIKLYAIAPFFLLLFDMEAEACEAPAMPEKLARMAGGKAKSAGAHIAAGKLAAIVTVAALTVGVAALLLLHPWTGPVMTDTEESTVQQENTLTALGEAVESEESTTEENEEQTTASEESGIEETTEKNPARELFATDEYENWGSAYGGSIPVKKDGKWGAVNYANEVIVPCIYDGSYTAPDERGNFVLIKSGEAEQEYFLFDNQGQLLYQGVDRVCASGGMYITRHEGEEYVRISYHSLDGVELAALDCEYKSSYLNGFYEGISNVCVAGEPREQIVTVDSQGNLSWRLAPSYERSMHERQEELKEETQEETIPGIVVNVATGWGGGYIQKAVRSTMNHGYYVMSSLIVEGLEVYDAADNLAAVLNYYHIFIDESGKVCVADNYTYFDNNDYRGFWADGCWIFNYGSRMVFILDGKNVLMDFSKNTIPEGLDIESSVTAVYDYIAMADEEYWLVQSGEKWGYIDHDGREMALYEDASAFSGGYALVREDGKAYLIDESFERRQELGGADQIYALGELFWVREGDVAHVYLIEE